MSHLIDYHEQTISKELIDNSEIERFIETYIDCSDELKTIYIDNKTDDLSKQIVENLRPVLQDFANVIKLSLPI